jgi:hypothetical protein
MVSVERRAAIEVDRDFADNFQLESQGHCWGMKPCEQRRSNPESLVTQFVGWSSCKQTVRAVLIALLADRYSLVRLQCPASN